MKHIWIIVAIICLAAAVHSTLNEGIKESYLFFIFALVSLIMFFLRNLLDKQEKK